MKKVCYVSAFVLLLSVSGCTTTTIRQYEPVVFDLDGLNVLKISTYPADYPARLTEKTDLFEEYESSDKLYFQLFIHDKEKEVGPNPSIKSIVIHSFSYQIGDAPPEQLLSEFQGNFWMQGDPRYNNRDLPPVPYLPGGKIAIKISFTLNDEEYKFEGELAATNRTRVIPTALKNMGI